MFMMVMDGVLLVGNLAYFLSDSYPSISQSVF